MKKILLIAAAENIGGSPSKSTPPALTDTKPTGKKDKSADESPESAPPVAKVETLDQIIARLKAENQTLATRVAEADAKDKERSADELLIAQKVGKGLTRAQAISVIERQKAHDKALTDKKAKRLPELQAILKNSTDEISARRNARIVFQDLDGSEFAEAVASLKKK